MLIVLGVELLPVLGAEVPPVVDAGVLTYGAYRFRSNCICANTEGLTLLVAVIANVFVAFPYS